MCSRHTLSGIGEKRKLCVQNLKKLDYTIPNLFPRNSSLIYKIKSSVLVG